MRVDNGAELVNEEIRKFAEEEGITIERLRIHHPKMGLQSDSTDLSWN